tara:strand:- start:289 stop:483 length:195 start_codon:yes stop_codon:yes gene_type:complete
MKPKLIIGDLVRVLDEDNNLETFGLGTLLSFVPVRGSNNSLEFLWEVLVNSDVYYIPEKLIRPI